jgi:hypothetical protein
MKVLATTLLFAVTAMAQTTPAPPANGSIAGTITRADDGAPVLGLEVSVNGSTVTRTDSNGRYRFVDLAPGPYFVNLSGASIASASFRDVKLADGQDLTGLDFALEFAGSISGRITDWNKKPVPNASVLLVDRVYVNGKVSYAEAATDRADPEGRYSFEFVQPGRSHAVLARPAIRTALEISPEPEDPEKRAPVAVPTFYPNSDFFEGAQIFKLRSGQKLEDVDIRMTGARSWCAEGLAEDEIGPAPVSFDIVEARLPNNGSRNNVLFRPRSRPDGTFRVCGLHPGDYNLLLLAPLRVGNYTVYGPSTMSTSSTQLTITNKDLTDIKVKALPGMTVSGELVLDVDSPAQATDGSLPIGAVRISSGPNSVQVSLPGHFTFVNMPSAECAVNITGLPRGFYVKAIDYGGVKVLHRTFVPGSSSGALRIIVAHDAGSISAKVNDADGHPVPNATVWMLPANAGSPAELQEVLLAAGANASGVSNSDPLPPGKYRVFATTVRFDRSAEHIDQLWDARWKGTELDVAPNGTSKVTLQPIAIF